MGRPREKEYNFGDPDLPNQSDAAVIAKIIEYRWEKNKDKGMPKKLQPKLEFNLALTTLFEADELWIKVKGVRFVPDAVVKSLIVRVDSKQLTRNDLSSFVGSQKEKLLTKFGVWPLSAWNRQKEQYWDEPFSKIFFASIQEANLHPSVHWNHTAYTAFTIRETVNIDELREIDNKAQAFLLKVVTNRWNPYLIIRR